MTKTLQLIAFGLLCAFITPGRSSCLLADQPIAEILRRIPPVGMQLPEAKRTVIEAALGKLDARINQLVVQPLPVQLTTVQANPPHEWRADIEIYSKAVRLALRFNEFYRKEHFDIPFQLIATANERLDQLAQQKHPWHRQTGLVVRGYRSHIDGSVQPYGLEIPEGFDFSRPAVVYVWLHGRGDKTTDLHFMDQRQSRPGKIHPENAIVLHPFGRHCIGFKSAGEIDVLDAIKDVQANYNVDADRIVLMGFSMGGAGVWHLAAHYPDWWCGAAPGAGFAETAQYNRLKPGDFPAEYVQTLWKVYDVPNYARNLFNFPVVAYSGEEDKQIQAARVMEKAFASHDVKLQHVIGPGMGHKYHPDSLQQIMRVMSEAVARGREKSPAESRLQTQTLRYNKAPGFEILQLYQHWREARVDYKQAKDKTVTLTTTNVKAISLDQTLFPGTRLTIDDQQLAAPGPTGLIDSWLLTRGNSNEKWDWMKRSHVSKHARGRKTPGMQGPIDDAIMAPFLVVLPGGRSKNEKVERWVRFEIEHFRTRWQALFRGDLREKLDRDITRDDERNFNLIVWGDPDSNSYLEKQIDRLPVRWTAQQLVMAGQSYDSAGHVPLMIQPNPAFPQRYIVLNSGPTFRESHDRTNSLQNPQLPDWAVVDLAQDPDGATPGKIVAADFFDEDWKFKSQ